MVRSVESLAALYRINTALVKRALKGLTREQIESRPGTDANSMHWILGHLVSYRYRLLEYLGSNSKAPYGDLFHRGAQIKGRQEYPKLKELMEHWDTTARELESRLDQVSEDQLSSTISQEFPGLESTVQGGITFLNFHETYHVGQLAYIRRLHHQDQLVG